MKIVVAGGAGGRGCLAVQDLAGCPPVTEVVLADRDAAAATRVARAIAGDKLSLAEVDVRDHEALVQALRGAACCLNATPCATSLDVMGACLEAGCAYADLGGLFDTTRRQLALHDQFFESGLSAVIGMGGAPGISNVQARHAAGLLDTVDTVRVYAGLQQLPAEPLLLGYRLGALVDELTLPPLVYRDGDFAVCEPRGEPEITCFDPPLGPSPTHLVLHSEVATLPASLRDQGVREVLVKTNGWGLAPETLARLSALVEFGLAGRVPVIAGETTVVPRDLLLSLLAPYASQLACPAEAAAERVEEIITEVRGGRFGRPVTVRLSTRSRREALAGGAASSIVACWLAEGRIPPGVHPPERAVDPLPFFRELEQRGIHTRVSVTEAV